MRAIKISLKTAKHLVDILGRSDHSGDVAAVRELRASMAPKKFVKAAKARKATKKASKRDETAAIREAVMKRADNHCECGCGYLFKGSNWLSYANEAELDHFFPKGRTKQTVKTCWALTRACHRLKTDNKPDAAFWLRRFICHAENHDYAAEARLARGRLESLELTAEAAALSREAAR